MRSPYNRFEKSENEHDSAPVVLKERYERCNFCHSKLVYTHDLNFGYLQVVETGRCSSCGVTLTPRRFTLH